MGRTGHCTAEIRGCSWKAAVRPNPEVALESKVRDTIHVPVQHSLLVYFFCGIIYHSMQKTLFALGLGLGGLITYVDTRPNWDDTGVSALVIFLSCGLLGVTSPARPWLWALAVGSWIPVLGITLKHNFGSLLALLIAFAGAYAGVAFRKLLARA